MCMNWVCVHVCVFTCIYMWGEAVHSLVFLLLINRDLNSRTKKEKLIFFNLKWQNIPSSINKKKLLVYNRLFLPHLHPQLSFLYILQNTLFLLICFNFSGFIYLFICISCKVISDTIILRQKDILLLRALFLLPYFLSFSMLLPLPLEFTSKINSYLQVLITREMRMPSKWWFLLKIITK